MEWQPAGKESGCVGRKRMVSGGDGRTPSTPKVAPNPKHGHVLASKLPPWVCWHQPGPETTTISTPPAASPSLEQRLACLEAHNRELRRQLGELRLAVAVIALGMILHSAWRTFFTFPVRATVVDARQVIVRDFAGRVRLVLGTDDNLPDAFRARDNPGVFLCDEKGAPCGASCTPARS
jgi:hypothetical protein